MKLFLCLLFCTIAVGLALASDGRCDYNYCVKDELYMCKGPDDRGECNKQKGLYITYRKESWWPKTSHVCCLNWTINQLSDKSLYCVRNVRSAEKKCTTEKTESYDYRFTTRCKDIEFSCL